MRGKGGGPHLFLPYPSMSQRGQVQREGNEWYIKVA